LFPRYGNGTISEQKELKAHVVEFYKQLFGSSCHSGVHLSNSFWPTVDQLDEGDKKGCCHSLKRRWMWSLKE
jgi:hypothetical protein